jgi:molybdopterin biosynthesis enzyme
VPRVSIVSTGSELIDVVGQPAEGQIRESNRFMLAGMVRQEYCDILKISMVPDLPQVLNEAFEEALKADVALICGGMSVCQATFEGAGR